MQSSRRKLQLAYGLGAVLLLLPASGCKGFFVNAPTSVTVNGSQSLNSGDTPNFTALAAFSDGTTKDVTQSATWSTSNPCIVAIISTPGTNAGHAQVVGTGGSVTINASYNGTTGTLTPTAPTGLTITPCPEQVLGTNTFPQVVFTAGQSNVTFSASGATGTITWTSSNSSVVNINSTTGVATFPAAGTGITITATAGTATGTLLVTVQ